MTSLAVGVPVTVVSILGLLLNGYILLLVIVTKQAHTANNLLLLHLGLVDSLLCALFLLTSAPSILRGGAWLGVATPCTLQGFLFTLLHPVALWTVCGLNCDRYYAIAAPLHYGAMVSPRRVAAGLGAAWVLSLLLCLPPLFLVAPYRYIPSLGGCAPDFTFATGGATGGTLWYSAAYTLLTLLLPAALMLGCNIKVLMIARYHRHRIASAIFEVALSAQVTITHQRNPFAAPCTPTATPTAAAAPLRSGRRAVGAVLQLLGACLLLYFPYYGLILWQASCTYAGVTTPEVTEHMLTFAAALLSCSPPVNGLLYGVKSKLLRKTFQNYWRKQMSKSEMIQEIQARTPSACGSRRPSVTPLGILTRPCTSHLQRRLSEVLLDPQRSSNLNAPNRPKIQRIASELNWRPCSTSGLGLSLSGINNFNRCTSFKDRIRVQQCTVSCNTLQVPQVDMVNNVCTSSSSLRASSSILERPSMSTANLFLQRVFGISDKEEKSPRIMITRAFSEESEHSPTQDISGGKDNGRKYSTSTTSLPDRRWNKKCPRMEENSRCTERREQVEEGFTSTTADNNNNKNNANGCSSSEDEDEDDVSDASSGRLYFSLDGISRNSTLPASDVICIGVGNSSVPTNDVSSIGIGNSMVPTSDLSSAGDGNSTVPTSDVTSEGVENSSAPAYILSWPTSRRRSVAVASRTRVQLARSFVDITDGPEFVL